MSPGRNSSLRSNPPEWFREIIGVTLALESIHHQIHKFHAPLASNPIVRPDFAPIALAMRVAVGFSFIGCEKYPFKQPATVQHSALPEDRY